MAISSALNDRGHVLTDGFPENGKSKERRPKSAPDMLLTQRITKFFADRTKPADLSTTYPGALGELAGEKTSDTPWQILFQAVNDPEPKYIGLDILGLAVIGRADPESGTQPDLDLTPYEGQSNGVSRRHAVLMPTDEGLCLIDLDSANGTWIGGKYLRPGQKYRLRSGDMVEFGSLKLMVRVIGSTTRGLSIRSTTQTRNKPPQR
ncbi:MAG: FHA domain-containing protein [Anaerolineae bacterium]|nr:FHA domain-containing protein [Anaerolineae bacterium]